MRQLFLLPFVIFPGCSSENEKPINCEEFRTGTFIQTDHENNITIKYTRTDTLQTEFNLTENTKYISRVVWINSCNYDLYRIHADKTHPSVDSIQGNRPIHVSIDKTADDYYIFTVRIDGFEREYSDTLFRVK